MADPGLPKKLYRILSWTSLAGLIVTMVLVLHKSPPPNVPNDPQAAARAEQKFQAADQARAGGQPGQVSLDRTELNSYLAKNLSIENPQETSSGPTAAAGEPHSRASGGSAPASGSAPAPSGDPLTGVAGPDQPTLEQVQSSVKDVKVDMDGDTVKAYVIFDFHGKDLSLELDGHLRAEDGYLRFEPTAGKLGSLPLPKSTLDSAVEKLMASPENREKLRLPDGVRNIQIVNGQAVISYK